MGTLGATPYASKTCCDDVIQGIKGLTNKKSRKELEMKSVQEETVTTLL